MISVFSICGYYHIYKVGVSHYRNVISNDVITKYETIKFYIDIFSLDDLGISTGSIVVHLFGFDYFVSNIY